ncbi:hypothetical protein ACFL0X_00385 [Nanoarchaeota archaeon]
MTIENQFPNLSEEINRAYEIAVERSKTLRETKGCCANYHSCEVRKEKACANGSYSCLNSSE